MTIEGKDLTPELKLLEVVKILSKNGIRVTEQRKRLALILIQSSGFFSAMDLVLEMSKYFPGMSFDTVYRNVRLFREFGIIEYAASGDGVKFAYFDSKKTRTQFICLQCEKNFPVHLQPHQLDLDVPEQFQPVAFKMDVYGYCKECGNGRSHGLDSTLSPSDTAINASLRRAMLKEAGGGRA
jgi:Fur family zinc uptake transcriptional regulator